MQSLSLSFFLLGVSSVVNQPTGIIIIILSVLYHANEVNNKITKNKTGKEWVTELEF